MLFNSIEFGIFLPIVFIIYWFLFTKNLNLQNLFLVASSYFFYGWWDWRFLSLLFFSSLVDYLVGIALLNSRDSSKRKYYLLVSIVVNLGLLGVFKYYNFFADSFVNAFTLLGTNFSIDRMSLILPIGISFYTFQTLSYSIDVYYRKLEPTNNIISFMAYVSFFPQLVAGPIERAKNLLPQFFVRREFNYSKSVDGLRQILWGLFKKMVIADNCAMIVNTVFSNSNDLSGGILIIGVIFFAFQIYGDFSGYSDIAIGTAKLFGFNLMRNFNNPYFSRDIAEFWRRWHISLSSWFRDYVYIPLGGSRVDYVKKVRNIFIIFILSGFWHGANWTFIFWGGLNAIYILPLLLMNKNRVNINSIAENSILPSLKVVLQIGTTFTLTCFAWIFFRADSLNHAFSFIFNIFTKPGFSTNDISLSYITILYNFILIAIMIVIEWFQRNKEHGLDFFNLKTSSFVRWSIYYCIIFTLIWYSGKQEAFIYFQF